MDVSPNDKIIKISDSELVEAYNKSFDKQNTDSNNGLITSIWGPSGWEYAHSVSFGYPNNPTEEDKKNYLIFFKYFGKTLPCSLCVLSYGKFIKERDTLLDKSVMESRETLTKWLYKIHQKVNKKLGVNYGTTFEEVCYKYESYRAKCIKDSKGCYMPLDDKACSYRKSELHRAPLIDKEYALSLIDYANEIGFKDYQSKLEHFMDIKRNSKEWLNRDRLCRKIINIMRKQGFDSMIDDLPTEFELLLNSMLSSNLSDDKRKKISDSLSR
jgi:hypothetical protein